MKKNSLKYNNDEIDLTDIIKNFWDKKINFFLIILVSIFVGIGYGNRGQELYQGSLKIMPSSNSEFANFFIINRFLSRDNLLVLKENDTRSNEDQTLIRIDNETSLDQFIKEFLKYEQLISVLKKIDYIKEEVSKLAEVDQQKTLFRYAQQFTMEVDPKENKIDHYIVKFKWHDAEEGIEILTETLNLVSKTISKKVFSDLKVLTNVKKNFVINEDLIRIEYLNEQAEIANELGIETMSPIGLDTQASFNFNSSTSLNFNSSNVDYYLRGSKAIEKEINIITNRKYKEFDKIEKEIDFLKNNSEINWVDYNLFLIKVELIKNSNMSLKISIISGFIIAFIYIVVTSATKPKKLI